MKRRIALAAAALALMFVLVGMVVLPVVAGSIALFLVVRLPTPVPALTGIGLASAINGTVAGESAA